MDSPIQARALGIFPRSRKTETEGAVEIIKLIAIASQKGGSGKTTLAAHLAVEAEIAGAGPVIVHQRVVFAGAMIDGRTAMENQANSKASGEIGSLWRFLSDRMEGKVELALRRVN